MNSINKLLLSFLSIVVFLVISCNDNDLPNDSFDGCDWMVGYTSTEIDSCFVPPRDGLGLLPPTTTVGREITYMGFNRRNSDVLYYITSMGSTGPVDLHQLDLCIGEASFITSFNGIKDNNMYINEKNQLIFIDEVGDVSVYDINSNSLNVVLSDVIAIDVAWLGNDKYIVERDTEIDGNLILTSIVYNLNGSPLDTILFSSASIGEYYGSIIAISARLPEEDKKVHVYDFVEQEIVNTYEVANNTGGAPLIHTTWLNQDELIIYGGSDIALIDFTSGQITTVLDFSNCKNIFINEVAVIPSSEEEILILRQEYFYDDNDEFSESFDLIRYNLVTGEEKKLVF